MSNHTVVVLYYGYKSDHAAPETYSIHRTIQIARFIWYRFWVITKIIFFPTEKK